MKVTVAPVAETMANLTVFGDATDRRVAETKLQDVIQTEKKTHSSVNYDSVPVLFAVFLLLLYFAMKCRLLTARLDHVTSIVL